MTTALPFDGAVVGGRENLILSIQVRISRQASSEWISRVVPRYGLGNP